MSFIVSLCIVPRCHFCRFQGYHTLCMQTQYIQQKWFSFPQNGNTTSPSKYVHNIYTMLDQRRRRWPTLYKCCTYILCSLGDVINVAETELKTEWFLDVLFIV